MKIHFISEIDYDLSQFCPPLGIGYLASYMRKFRPDIELSFSHRSPYILAEIEKENPDLICISTTSRFFNQLLKIAEIIHNEFNIPIIWGGVHTSIAPEDIPHYSVGVIREGEKTLLELVEFYEQHGRLTDHQIQSTVYYDRNNKLVINKSRPLIEGIDSVPPPDFDLLKVEWNKDNRGVVMTSRGCPYKCSFCISSEFWKKIRFHSPERVVDEIELLQNKYNLSEILIYDDLFIADIDRLRKISNLIVDKGLNKKLRFECLGRANYINREVAGYLKKMNVYLISIGLESGSPRLLKYHKGSNIDHEMINNAINLVKAEGISAIVSVMLGGPGETVKEIDMTYNMLRKLKIDYFGYAICTPFPGTKLWNDCRAKGIVGQSWDEKYFVLDPTEYKIKWKKKVLICGLNPKIILRYLDKFDELNRKLCQKYRLKKEPKLQIITIMLKRGIVIRLRKIRQTLKLMVKKVYSNFLFSSIKWRFFDSFLYRFLIKFKEKRLLDVPPVINIETTNYCNAKCIMCPHKDMTRKKEHMQDQLFNKIINDLEGHDVKILSLNLIGEPFMDPGFIKRIETIKSNKKLKIEKLSFVTNGSLMKKDIVSKLLDLDIDEIIISINGGDDESYNKIMGLNFGQVMLNLSRLLYEKKSGNRPAIKINCIKLDDNKDSIEFIKDFFEKYVDGISISEPVNWGGYLGNRVDKLSVPCRILWTDINIQVDGEVIICCRDWDASCRVGNVNDHNIFEILNGQKFNALRRLHLNGKLREIPICKNCDAIPVEAPYWLTV